MVQAIHPRYIRARVAELLQSTSDNVLYAIVSYQLEDNDAMIVCSTGDDRSALVQAIGEDGPRAFESCQLEACSASLSGATLGFGF